MDDKPVRKRDRPRPDEELYCDGGVIDRNPSKIGGTWAFAVVRDDKAMQTNYGILLPSDAELPAVSNNVSELLALVRGLQALPHDFQGVVYSDSQVTLGRVFGDYAFKGVPGWLYHELLNEKRRLMYWSRIENVLLKGHPTEAELFLGRSKDGRPVSRWQKACDKMCRDAAIDFLRKTMGDSQQTMQPGTFQE